VNALPSPEDNKEAVQAIHSTAGTFCTRVGHWRRRLQATWPFFRPSPGSAHRRSFAIPWLVLHLALEEGIRGWVAWLDGTGAASLVSLTPTRSKWRGEGTTGCLSHTSIYATAIGLPGEPVAPLSRSGLKI
jgi:hypothetical protein